MGCDNPAQQNGGASCVGDETDIKSCNIRPCPVHGEWSPWAAWPKCGPYNGSDGIKWKYTRHRNCDAPRPAHGGRGCVECGSETKRCWCGGRGICLITNRMD